MIPVLVQVQQKNESCPECGGNYIVQDNITGEQVCQSCGIVISSKVLDSSPEWRTFNPIQREKRPRVGAPLTWTIHDNGLSTYISWKDQDASGKRLTPQMKTRLYRLRKWQRRIKLSNSKARSLSNALNEMKKIQSKLNLPHTVIETSSMIYRKALKANLVRGRTTQSIVVACLYMACRQCGVIRSLEEVAESINSSKKDVARNYRFLLRELKTSVPHADPQDYIGRIVSRMMLSGETEMIAKSLLYQATLMKLTGGRAPAGLAAACVYISTKITGERRSQVNIAKEAQVTEVTIRNRYKELFENLVLEIKL